jgi:hypothetical protein
MHQDKPTKLVEPLTPHERIHQQMLTERNRHAFIFVFLAFSTALVSSQAFKSATARHNKELELVGVKALLLETRDVLKSLVRDETVREMARTCAREISESGSTSNVWDRSGRTPSLFGWWTGASSKDETADDAETSTSATSSLEELIFKVLQKELRRRIGQAGLTDAEKDKTTLHELSDTDQLMAELYAESELDEDVSSEHTGQAVLTDAEKDKTTLKGLYQLMAELNAESELDEDVGSETTIVQKRIY